MSRSSGGESDGPPSQPGHGAPVVRIEHLETLRTARVCLLGGSEASLRAGAASPSGAAGTTSRPQPVASEVWYVLHGYRQLAPRFLPRFSAIASPDRLIVAPEASSRFYLRRSGGAGRSDEVGASWMTREDREHEIRDYVRYLNSVAATVERDRVGARDSAIGSGTVAGGPLEPGPIRRVLLGFSQGGHTAARWAVLGRFPPSRLVLWGSSLPSDLPAPAAERLRGVELILVRGERDRLRREDVEAREERWLEEAGVDYRVVVHPGGHEIDSSTLLALASEESA